MTDHTSTDATEVAQNDKDTRIRQLEQRIEQLEGLVESLVGDEEPSSGGDRDVSRRTVLETLAGAGVIGVGAGTLYSGRARAATSSSFWEGGQLRGPSGNLHVEFPSSDTTRIYSGDGSGFRLNIDPNKTQLQARPSTPVRIFDNDGGFIAAEYTPSSTAPGTFGLKNAELHTGSNDLELQRTTIFEEDKGGGTKPFIDNDSGGEWVARDDDGNETQLT
jgi:hypothetical protein